MSVEARGGYRYFVTFTDDLIIYGYIYLMKHKSETFEKFKEFQSEVENHHNKKIKFLRSDRRGEYLSHEFGTDLRKCGIVLNEGQTRNSNILLGDQNVETLFSCYDNSPIHSEIL